MQFRNYGLLTLTQCLEDECEEERRVYYPVC